MKRISWAILITVSGLFTSCSKNNGSTANLYVPTNADVTANATLVELQQGRTLYINNCGVCHSLYSPDDYSATQWKSIISGMAPRTDMNASQVNLVTKYVSRGK
jgi:mono/diheme cytochrome c family protein